MTSRKINIKRVDGVTQGYHVGSVDAPTSSPDVLTGPVQVQTVQDSVSSAYEQFAKTHPASNELHISDSMVKINTNYPYPQANSLSKVAAVVDAVSGLADTDEGVAAAIGVVPRQGAYYATAAGYLGLLAETGSSPRTWGLTSLGVVFLESDSDSRVELLSGLVAQIPAADTVETLGDDFYTVDEIEVGENLSTATASRRASALSSWVKTLASENSAMSLTLESDGVAGRIIDAASVASAGRERARLRAHVEPVYEVCPDCFMQKSASGGCGC